MKYQIFGPTGNKVCIVEAELVCFTGNSVDLYEDKPSVIKGNRCFGSPDQLLNCKLVCTLPVSWVIIPFGCITD